MTFNPISKFTIAVLEQFGFYYNKRANVLGILFRLSVGKTFINEESLKVERENSGLSFFF